jgi:DNA-directed RNA polymerase specialized sigma24 family protein
MGKHKLTEEQRCLIEENHGLIYGYLYDRHIELDYYGDFAEKLCLAIPHYDPDKATLSTFVYNVFDNYWKNILKHKYKPSRYIPIGKRVPIDSYLYNNNSEPVKISEIIGADDVGYEMIEDIDLVAAIRRELKLRYPKDKITNGIIDYIIKGYNCREVGDIYGVSRQAINARVQKIKKIYNDIKEEYK